MGCRICSRLDALFPSVTSRVEKQQSKQAAYYDSQKLLRSFKVGNLVYAKDFSTMSTSWTPGKVTNVTGPLSYRVELLNGCDVRRHVDAICNRVARYPRPQPQVDNSDDDFYLPDIPVTPTTPPTPAIPTTVPPVSCSTSVLPAACSRPPPNDFAMGLGGGGGGGGGIVVTLHIYYFTHTYFPHNYITCMNNLHIFTSCTFMLYPLVSICYD